MTPGFKSVLGFIVPVLVSVVALGAAHSAGEEDFRDIRLTGSFEQRSLDGVAELSDDAVRKQKAALAGMVERIERGLEEMLPLSASIRDAVTRWTEAPTPENEARFSLAVSEAASRLRQAADSLGAMDQEIDGALKETQAELRRKSRELARAIKKARERKAFIEAEHARVRRAAIEAKRMLEKRGYFHAEDIPAEMEDALHRIRVDFEELSAMRQIWPGVEDELQGARVLLEKTEENFERIRRAGRMIAYRMRSFGRVAAHIGAAESSRIGWKLTRESFAGFGEIREKTVAILKGMQKTQELLSTLTGAATVGRIVDDQDQDGDGPGLARTGILDWFRDIPDERAYANTNR